MESGEESDTVSSDIYKGSAISLLGIKKREKKIRNGPLEPVQCIKNFDDPFGVTGFKEIFALKSPLIFDNYHLRFVVISYFISIFT